ncbi:unnamed protein product, partial [Schistosoma turkestanicum]
MGTKFSILSSTGIDFHEQITKRLFKHDKAKLDQSCQSTGKQFICYPKDNIDDKNDEHWIQSIDENVKNNHEIQSFHCDENYPDQFQYDTNDEYETNNAIQSFKSEQSKLQIDDAMKQQKSYDTAKNNDNTNSNECEQFLQPEKQYHERIINNLNENPNRMLLDDFDNNNSFKIDYFKLPEYPNLLRNDSFLSTLSMNSLCTESILNRNAQMNDDELKIQDQHLISNIQNLINNLKSSID